MFLMSDDSRKEMKKINRRRTCSPGRGNSRSLDRVCKQETVWWEMYGGRGRQDVSVSKACHKYLKTSMRPEAGRVDFNLQEDQQKKPGQGETGPTRQ